MTDLLTVPQVAEQLRVSTSRVRQLLREGRLQGQKVGRDWLVVGPVSDPRMKAGRPRKGAEE